MKNKYLIITIIILLCLNLLLVPNVMAQDTEPPTINIIYPKEEQRIPETMPTIKAEFSDESGIDQDSVIFRISGLIDRPVNIIDWDETELTETSVTFEISEIFELKNLKTYNLTLIVKDNEGNRAEKEWGFIVDTSLAGAGGEIDIFAIITFIAIALIIAAIAFTVYILILKKTKKFTFRKYFAQHPVHKKYLVLYLPMATAFLFVVFGLGYASQVENLPELSFEYVFILGILMAITPYTIESILEKNYILKYERAFSQFLFEMADAMRSGLDPNKAVIELAKTETGIMKEHLKSASEQIKIGRPFDEVIPIMVKNIDSTLIKRYAKLIADAATIGGETAQVIFRSAKDMDDFIKVTQDRRRQLSAQSFTIYISFIVLLIIIYMLISIFPSIKGIDISLLGSSDLQAASQAQVASATVMDLFELKRRFFHLLVINSLGTGLVIGGFLEGKVKHGLIHVIILLAVVVIFFHIMIL